jgi:alkanesulfonate monooxygenase SsuD/methylene tetrahydromethanopterin reductase-like flavin-dependent oxidoreductase (luciferase family)
MTVRYAVYLPPFGPFGDPRVLVDLAVRAEAAGWDGVFLWDHLVSGSLPVTDTWTALAAIAQATDRILLGPTVTPLPRRRPWVVARQAAAVSRLSAGRLILGVGLGSDESGDFSRFGEPADVPLRAAMLDEGLEIVRAMWAGRPWSGGRHYRVTLEPADPEPHQLPVWVASSTGSASVLRRAAGCDGIFPNPATLASVTAIRRRLTGDIVVAGNASPAWLEPVAVDLAALTTAGMTWWLESLMHVDPLALSLRIVDAGPPRP